MCEVCRGAATPGHRICWSCDVVRSQLGGVLTPVVPISLFAPGTALHEILVALQGGAVASCPPRARRVALTAGERVLACAPVLPRGAGADERLPQARTAGTESEPSHARGAGAGRRLPLLAVPVPSSSWPRASWGGEHPLVGLVGAALVSEPRLQVAPLLVRGPGPLGHLRACPRRLSLGRAGEQQARPGPRRHLHLRRPHAKRSSSAASRRCRCPRHRADRAAHPS